MSNSKAAKLNRQAERERILKGMTLEDLTKWAFDHGFAITPELKPKEEMAQPMRPVEFPSDGIEVRFLVKESRRATQIAENWATQKPPNMVAAQKAAEMGWAYSLAAALLRCYLKGELQEKPPERLGCAPAEKSSKMFYDVTRYGRPYRRVLALTADEAQDTVRAHDAQAGEYHIVEAYGARPSVEQRE